MPNLKAIAQLLSKIRWGGYFAPPPPPLVKLWTYRYPGKTRVKNRTLLRAEILDLLSTQDILCKNIKMKEFLRLP